MLTQLTCFVSAISCLTESLESLPSYQLLLDSFSVYLLLFSLTFPSYFLSPQLLNVGGGTEWTFETPKPILRDHPSIRSIHTNLYKPFKYFPSLVIKHSNILAYGDYHIQTLVLFSIFPLIPAAYTVKMHPGYQSSYPT